MNAAAYKAGRRSKRGRGMPFYHLLWCMAAREMAGSVSLNMTSAFAAARFVGSVLGVSVGCLIGMAPLLFMEGREPAEEESESRQPGQ